MNSFGLPKEFCLEFLRKQSTIANITNGMMIETNQCNFFFNFHFFLSILTEQFKLLQDNIEAMYNAQK